MNNLYDVWNNIDSKAEMELICKGVAVDRHASDLEKFRKLLRLELLVGWCIGIVFLFYINLLSPTFIALFSFSLIIGTLLNLITLRKVTRFDFELNVQEFLVKSADLIKSFIYSFVVISQVGILFSILLLQTLGLVILDNALFITLIVLGIEVFFCLYVYFFYLRRYISIRKMIHSLQ